MSSNINNINISTLTELEHSQLQEKGSKANSYIRLALGDSSYYKLDLLVIFI